MTIQLAQEKVHQWVTTTGVRYFNELTNMAILTEEVGELSRHMARQYGEQSYKAGEEKGKKSSPMKWRMYYGYYCVLQTKRE